MIFDNHAHLDRYFSLGPDIEKALRFLQEKGQDSDQADGEHILREDRVKAVVITADTRSMEETRSEIHRNFMDIHFILEGEELFGFSRGFSCETDYDGEKDIVFGAGMDEVFCRACAGDFYMVWPGEGHRPLGRVPGNDSPVRKIICKVKIG